MLILICVILWGLAITLRLPLDDLLTFSGKAFLIAAGIHFILAFTHSCPVYGKHPAIQGFGQVHPASFTQSKLKGWSGVVVSVIRRSEFTCIHCGTHFRIKSERT